MESRSANQNDLCFAPVLSVRTFQMLPAGGHANRFGMTFERRQNMTRRVWCSWCCRTNFAARGTKWRKEVRVGGAYCWGFLGYHL